MVDHGYFVGAPSPVVDHGRHSPGYARGVRERDSGYHGSELKNESAWDARNAFSHNLRALSHDRAMLVLGESWTNGTATCVGLSTIFLDRRSATGELPAMSEW